MIEGAAEQQCCDAIYRSFPPPTDEESVQVARLQDAAIEQLRRMSADLS